MDKNRKKAFNFLIRRGLMVDNFDALTDEQIGWILKIRKTYFQLDCSMQLLKSGNVVFGQNLFYPQKYITKATNKDGADYMFQRVKLVGNNVLFCCYKCTKLSKQFEHPEGIIQFRRNEFSPVEIEYTLHDFSLLVEKNVNRFLQNQPFSTLNIRPLTNEEKQTLKPQFDDEQEYEIVDNMLDAILKSAPLNTRNEVEEKIKQAHLNAEKFSEHVNNFNNLNLPIGAKKTLTQNEKQKQFIYELLTNNKNNDNKSKETNKKPPVVK